ncbi:MAG TPA: hypothetical protein VMF51_13615 [Nocardioides sp.]|uniref:hypothetical protein n=1 Tax=Nocardioides sp. TaxID=35761 RepID=UPI002CFCDD84|nr:hypothetical protein [Nocardioides sp.]HTW16167.1 hypothetical protein [Nocardioides sp.]
MALVASGQMDDVRARVVWKVAESAVVQSVLDFAIPTPAYLVEPVRRVGTYEGARSRIAMLPVVREGRALMLTLDSGLELAWAHALVMHPDVSALYAQPFMLVWDHDEGSIVHIPDLTAVIDGQLVVFEVKPAFRRADPWIEARTALAQRSLGRAGTRYHLLSDVTRQMSMNLQILSGYRRPNPFLASEVRIALQSRSRSIGGVVEAICRERAGEAYRPPQSGAAGAAPETDFADGAHREKSQMASVRIGLEVAMHLLAVGHFHTNLDQPLRLSSVLSRQHPDVSSWAR